MSDLQPANSNTRSAKEWYGPILLAGFLYFISNNAGRVWEVAFPQKDPVSVEGF